MEPNIYENVPLFGEWIKTLPKDMVDDRLWEFGVYRKALYLTELTWFDCQVLQSDPRGRAISNQLIRSAGSIAANIEEGYGRGFGRDYARFLRIALGSARETKGWYFRGRRVLNQNIYFHRNQLISQIVSGLVSASRSHIR